MALLSLFERIHAFEDGLVLRGTDQSDILLLENLGIDSLATVLVAVVGNPVDEEQAQDLDSVLIELDLLVQVFLDGLGDHLAFDEEVIDIADGLIDPQEQVLGGE